MKRQRWFLLGLMVVMLSSWASLAQTSEVFSTSSVYYSGFNFDGNTHLIYVAPVGFMQDVFVNPTTPGLFSHQRIDYFEQFSGYAFYRQYPSGDPSGWQPAEMDPGFMGPTYANCWYDIYVNQSGPLRFTELLWEAKLLRNGSETTLFSLSADADLITNGGLRNGYLTFVLEENSYFTYSLTGNVIDTTPVPSAEQILSFFDTSLAGGTLTGEGPSKSGDGRLKALRNMIEVASDLIAAGNIEEAYQQLSDAYKKTDGDSHIPDFVDGDAALELAQMILDLKNSLMQTTSLALSTSATSHTPLPPTVLLLGSGLLGLAGWRRFRKE